MIKVKRFTFNPFQENTYVLYDETSTCLIVDPGMHEPDEREMLKAFIAEKALKPILVVNTHMHIDHILGNHFATTHYGIDLAAHKDCVPFLNTSGQQAQMFGLHLEALKDVDRFLDEGKPLQFGNSSLETILP